MVSLRQTRSSHQPWKGLNTLFRLWYYKSHDLSGPDCGRCRDRLRPSRGEADRCLLPEPGPHMRAPWEISRPLPHRTPAGSISPSITGSVSSGSGRKRRRSSPRTGASRKTSAAKSPKGRRGPSRGGVLRTGSPGRARGDSRQGNPASGFVRTRCPLLLVAGEWSPSLLSRFLEKGCPIVEKPIPSTLLRQTLRKTLFPEFLPCTPPPNGGIVPVPTVR